MNVIKCYTDGAFSIKTKVLKWGFIIVDNNDNIIFKDKGIIYDDYLKKLHQIGGELRAVMEGINYCKNNNLKADFHVDYIGLIRWINDLFNKKPWKTNNRFTLEYRNFCLENKDYINSMKKVKSHSNNKFNNLVDDYIHES